MYVNIEEARRELREVCLVIIKIKNIFDKFFFYLT